MLLEHSCNSWYFVFETFIQFIPSEIRKWHAACFPFSRELLLIVKSYYYYHDDYM